MLLKFICRKIDVQALLARRKQVAIVWCIEDVQEVRPDLNHDQAWEVLQECKHVHDCNDGFCWDFIRCVADMLFPELEETDEEESGHE